MAASLVTREPRGLAKESNELTLLIPAASGLRVTFIASDNAADYQPVNHIQVQLR